MPKSGALDDKAKAFIRDNWHKLPSREIAEALGVAQRTVMYCGLHTLKLGKKPRPSTKKDEESQPRREREALSFEEMLTALFSELQQQREALISELEALAKIPADDMGKLDSRRAQVEVDLARVEQRCVQFEELVIELGKVLGKPKTKDEEFHRLEDLIDFLSENAQREAEGRMMEKVKIATERVREDWAQVCQYEDGTHDQPLLCPESIVEVSDHDQRA